MTVMAIEGRASYSTSPARSQRAQPITPKEGTQMAVVMPDALVIPESWERSIDRATADHLQAVRVNDHTYTVRSTSKRGCNQHLVMLNAKGQIIHCSDCAGWSRGGRNKPCKHFGAVLKRVSRERGIKLQVERS